MLIRSAPLALERRRVPTGPLRVSEFARSLDVRGLWLFSPRYLTVDLTGNSPPLTWQGSAAINGGVDGASIDLSPSTTSGARLTFSTASPLHITTGGLTTWSWAEKNATGADDNATLFGLTYQGAANPFTISQVAWKLSGNRPQFNWNTGGTFQFNLPTSNWPENTPAGYALAHAFGSSVRGYVRGLELFADTTNTAAPSYGGTADILSFGYDGVNGRNVQARIYAGAVFARGLSSTEIVALEAEPYSLVEQRRTFLSLVAPSGAPDPQISVSGNGNTISDGDTTPSLADHTNFGVASLGGSPIPRTFVYSNPGTSTLTISGVTVPTGYTITTNLPGTIAAGASANLIVRLDASVLGVKSGDISVTHDAAGSPHNFAITGEVGVTRVLVSNRFSYPFNTFGSPF